MSVLIALTTATALIVSSGPVAQARAGAVSVSAQSVTIRANDCGTAHYTVRASFPEATAWTVTTTVVDPYGVESPVGFLGDPETSEYGEVFLCDGSDEPGTYQVRTDYESFQTIESGSTSTTFRVTVSQKSASALSVSRTALRKKSWKVSGRLTRAGRPWTSRPVDIQVRVEGTWFDLKRKRTDKSGRVTFTSTPTRRNNYLVRLHAPGTADVEAAVSRTFRLPKR